MDQLSKVDNSKRKIKIIFLLGTYKIGGKERQLTELIKALPDKKYELHLLVKSIQSDHLDEIEEKLTSWICLDIDHLNGLKSLKPFITHFKKIKPDIVHSWDRSAIVYAIIIRFLTTLTYRIIDGSIRDAWFPYSSLSKAFFKRIFINIFSDITICNSQAAINEYKVVKRKSYCIHNGYHINRDREITPKNNIISKFSIRGSFFIGMIARFTDQKDWYTFIDIAKAFSTTKPEIAFICVGGGETLDDIKIYANGLPNVYFTGIQNNTEFIVNILDIGILITNVTKHAEGISNTIMEYMSLGKPVIANDSGGTKEIVKDHQSGFLIKSNHFSEYIKKIEILYSDPNLRKKMGEYGKRILMEEFSMEKMIRNYEDIYVNSLNKNRFVQLSV